MYSELTNKMSKNNLSTGNYLKFDANLLNNPQYDLLSLDAKILYTLYASRMECSIYNHWLDEAGDYFIYFSNEEAAAILLISERKITTLRTQLLEAGLIQVVRHGLKNYRIYVSLPLPAPDDIAVKMPYKNYTTAKELKIQAPAEVVDLEIPAVSFLAEDTGWDDWYDLIAKSATTDQQEMLIRTEKQTKSTKATSVTETTASYPQKEETAQQQTALIDGLIATYQHLIPKTAFTRFLPFCNERYEEARWYVDTIFKAKYAATQQFIKAGLPAETESLTFEGNEYFTAGLADAVAKAMEQIHRFRNVKNPKGFFFAFMKGYFKEAARRCLADKFELTSELRTIFQSLGLKTAY